LQFLIISDDPAASKQGAMFEKLGETIEFAGMAVSKLAMDPNKLSKSGKILLTGDLAQEYNFEDLDGSTHDIRSISVLLKAMGWNWTSWFIPSFIRIPHFVMHFGSNKF
jgi:dehydrogenase/reductase SDR family protein 1